MIPTTTIDTLTGCWQSLNTLGAGLNETQWKQPTDLPGWTVQDNLSHLIGVERSLQGLPATAHRIDVPAHVRNPIGEMNEYEVDSRRTLSGADVFAEWEHLVQLRVATLRGGDEQYFAREMMTPTGPGTLSDFLHIRVLDCWLHEQDMRRAAGVSGNLSGAAAEHTVDRLIRTVPIVVGKRAATPEGRSVVLDITGGVQRHVVCEVRDGRAALVDQSTQEPLATIALDTESFVVLSTGRRTADQVHAKVHGDAAHAHNVLAQFNMMI